MPASTSTSNSPTTTNFPNGINAGGTVIGSDGSVTAIGPVTGANAINTGAIMVPGSVVTGLTAHAGGTQAAALALTGEFNRVDTVGSAADSVKLPAPTFVGQQITVVNNAATNSMQVFGSGTDTINGVTTTTGVAQAAGKMAIYRAATIGTAAAWFRLLSA